MELVLQTEESDSNGPCRGVRADAAARHRRPGARRTRRKYVFRLTAAGLTACALATGCAAQGGGSHPVRPAPGGPPLKVPAARALRAYAAHLKIRQIQRAAVAKRWGVAKVPILPPRPPTKKPVIKPGKRLWVHDQKKLGLPPVFARVPTKDKIVFLTIDDGWDKDRKFVKMMNELKIPYSAFLTNDAVKDDYGYYKKVQRAGDVLGNHTLHHRYLPALSYAQQKHEICGMQKIMKKRYGKRPVMFRPPYGNYNQDTLKAAKACGIKYVPLWEAEVFAKTVDYGEDDQKLHPGDIILTHFNHLDLKGSMEDMVRNLLKRITAKGYAVARLEDYL
ncbi:polysaccharide deacetylase family protein [Streptomyces beihaiensis]|uniref:Polysaccharide deacetylase family protein n=1 Tax=Streptomyces beihaiensis TaxID=2984495 RepID=A0ABT3TTJ4_9ACTN|nr:polysaccharide deacetylase family protein [Streptomyces beihaiensis]MCX3060336.1 polysaccharide deacetylase family protein [Streptomyces beihaiensis]